VRYGDGWYPNASSGDPARYIPAFREMAQEAGRDPKTLSLRLGGAPDDLDALKLYRDMGVDAVNVTLMSDKRDDILPVLDRWAAYIPQLRG
jgi:alkanesulfonate monooxygenase SsuD/methylene tetrahydromethanopterin reductase-like flavin-dependent oxidoreductase (luciferase family)